MNENLQDFQPTVHPAGPLQEGNTTPPASHTWRRRRRLFQWLTLAALFIIPALNVLEIYFVKGTFISMDVGDIAMADPFAILQAVISSRTFIAAMAVSLIVPVAVAFLFGRVWCSFICPYYLLAEGIDWLRAKLKMRPLKPAYTQGAASRSNAKRYIVLASGLLLVGIAGIPLLNLFSAPGIISSQALVLVKFHTVTFELVFLIIMLTVEFFFIYRFWCRVVCPTGTVLSLFRWKGRMRVEKLTKCSNCMNCRTACPMGLDPMKEGMNTLCINCAECVDSCPDNREKPTLKLRF